MFTQGKEHCKTAPAGHKSSGRAHQTGAKACALKCTRVLSLLAYTAVCCPNLKQNVGCAVAWLHSEYSCAGLRLDMRSCPASSVLLRSCILSATLAWPRLFGNQCEEACTASAYSFDTQTHATSQCMHSRPHTPTRMHSHDLSHNHAGHVWLFQHIHLTPPSPKQMFNQQKVCLFCVLVPARADSVTGTHIQRDSHYT